MNTEFLSRIRIILHPISKAFSGLVYPPYVGCPFCGRETVLLENGLCEDCTSSLCYADMQNVPAPLCSLYSLYQYTGAARNAVLRFKYSQATYLADIFAKQLSIPSEWHFDCIIPVPLHRSRLKKRGYNQSDMLADAISVLYNGIPVHPGWLKRVKRTRPQQGLSEAMRKHNLNGVFLASPSVSGLSILLVDDVSTTGTTLCCCADELIRKGASSVYAVTVCSVPKTAE